VFGRFPARGAPVVRNVRVWAICHVVEEGRAVKIFDRTLRSGGDITRGSFDAIIV
jgi:hypothetical protein